VNLLLVLLIPLVVTRFFGEVALRCHLPALVGELVAGIVLGMLATQFADALPGLAHFNESEVFRAITDLGVFFLMLLGGLEMRPRELAESSRNALWVAVGGMILPLAAGIGLGW
jgi:Kef-type K+ transport system membrane component KefB